MEQDGCIFPVGPGDLIMTRLGVTHGLEVQGSEPVELLVIEVYPPEVLERLPAHSPEA